MSERDDGSAARSKSPRAVHVKICGVTTVRDAKMCAAEGASAIGLNFVPSSPRRVSVALAREIALAVRDHVLVVGVVADLDVSDMLRLREDALLGCLQLHGDEPREALIPLLPHAYKAVRIEGEWDVARAALYDGEHLLVDAKVHGVLGGSGRSFDWTLVGDLARARKVTLAGGLTPENVGEAVRAVAPYCVDVASGVEAGTPGIKAMSRVRAFVAAANFFPR